MPYCAGQRCPGSKRMGHKFCITLKEGGHTPHKILTSISARHAAELTHLFMEPVYEDGVDLSPEQALSLGCQFTSLRVLDVNHASAGATKLSNDTLPTQKECMVALIRNAPALSYLRFESYYLSPSMAASFLPFVASRLRYLRLSVPMDMFPDAPKGKPQTTDAVRSLIAEHCTALVQPASISFHKPWTLASRPGGPIGLGQGNVFSAEQMATMMTTWEWRAADTHDWDRWKDAAMDLPGPPLTHLAVTISNGVGQRNCGVSRNAVVYYYARSRPIRSLLASHMSRRGVVRAGGPQFYLWIRDGFPQMESESGKELHDLNVTLDDLGIVSWAEFFIANFGPP